MIKNLWDVHTYGVKSQMEREKTIKEIEKIKKLSSFLVKKGDWLYTILEFYDELIFRAKEVFQRGFMKDEDMFFLNSRIKHIAYWVKEIEKIEKDFLTTD